MHFSTYDDYSDYLFSRKAENENISKACDLLARSDKNINKVINDAGLSPQEYIEVIALRRREGYSQSAGNGNVSAGNQTDKMYGNTPWKFIEEFLQNADDCKYADNPEIQITIDEQSGKIEFAYNEEGFTRGDIWALTAFEQSTKSNENDSLLDIVEEGVFFREKTGRKGIGFKSVFSLSADNVRVHIRSNQYRKMSFRLIKKLILLLNWKILILRWAIFIQILKRYSVSKTQSLFFKKPIGDYREICDAILEDEVIWDSSSNEHSEMLIRACMDANNPDLHKKYRDKNVYISMQYLVENNLQKLVLEVLVNHKFGQLRISNNGYFEERPLSIFAVKTEAFRGHWIF